jgi:hypothetical protein
MAKHTTTQTSPSWWERGWLVALIFLFPTHWFLQLSDADSYVQGLRVDYLILKLFVSQVLIWFLLAGWIWRERARWPEWKRTLLDHWMVALCVAALTATQLLSQRPIVGLWQLLSLLTAGGLAIYLWHHRGWVVTQPWRNAVMLALVFHSSIALGQWWLQGSVFPSYWWFGEPRLLGQPGLATGTWQGREFLLPYGVTAHPNVLAGSFVFYLVVLFRSATKTPRFWQGLKWLSIGLGLLTLGFTQSVTAFIGVSAGFTWHVFSHTAFGRALLAKLDLKKTLMIGGALAALLLVAAPLLFTAITTSAATSPSVTRRLWLADAAWRMWQDNPLFGVGLQQFTVHVEQFSQNREVVRFVQPVHHGGLLWLSELGIVGVGLVAFMAWLLFKKFQLTLNTRSIHHKTHLLRNAGTVVIVLLPILINDHYLLTSPAGLIGLIFLTYFSFLSGSSTRRL